MKPCKGKRSSPVSLAQRMRSPGSGLVAGGAPRGRRADPPSCWWRRRWAGSPRRPRSAAGRPDGAALGARLTRIPLGQAVRSSRSAGLSDVRTIPGLAVSVVGRGPGGLGDGVVDLRRVVRQGEPRAVGHPPTGQELNGLLRSSGPVDAHQDPPPGSGAEPGLVQCPADDLDVVGGSV